MILICECTVCGHKRAIDPQSGVMVCRRCDLGEDVGAPPIARRLVGPQS